MEKERKFHIFKNILVAFEISEFTMHTRMYHKCLTKAANSWKNKKQNKTKTTSTHKVNWHVN